MTSDEKIYNHRRLYVIFADLCDDFGRILNADGNSINIRNTVEFEKRLKNLSSYFKTQAELQELFKKHNV